MVEVLTLSDDFFNCVCQVVDVNRRQVIRAACDHREGCEVRVETDPGASEELVEDVILLTVTIEEARADNMHSDAVVGLREG